MKAASDNRYGHRDATMILIAFRHGLRASELCALRWDNIDLAQATPRAKNWLRSARQYPFANSVGKSRAVFRSFPALRCPHWLRKRSPRPMAGSEYLSQNIFTLGWWWWW
jgi:integrase